MYYFSQSLLLRFCLHLWSLAILLSWGLLWFSLCLPCLWFFELVEAMDLQISLNLYDFQLFICRVCVCARARACTHVRAHTRSVVPDSLGAHGLWIFRSPLHMEFSKQECWNGLYFLLQGIFLTQRSNSCLLHFLVSLILRPILKTLSVETEFCLPYSPWSHKELDTNRVSEHTCTHNIYANFLYTFLHQYTIRLFPYLHYSE